MSSLLPQIPIDLRSDTVTRPSKEMLEAMKQAPVGDDVYGEDPSVNSLQKFSAELFGKEAGLFVPSGTMGNQLCLRAHTEPGDEVICDYKAHIFNYESGAAGNLSQVQLHPLHGKHGILEVDQIREAIREKAYWNPWTKLIALENTGNKAGGTVYPLERIRAIHEFAREKGLLLHLDGARLWNAHIESGIPLKEYARYFDSLSVCFSKGLGAPVGSMVLGTESFIRKVHRFRKMWGGGMRQAGSLAAACRFAVTHHLEGIRQDHIHLGILAEAFSKIPGVSIDWETVRTNILIADVSGTGKTAAEWSALLKEENILVSPFSATTIRMVTHRDVTPGMIDTAVTVFESFSQPK
ncbi:MAG: low specificity L-threonine aldolase [Bacteroidetes bacterium]|nr:low specificity L-threonine aldolase [Bacteroidota bacterium]